MTGATPGQAAFETHELASSYQWGSGAHPWDHGNPTSQLIWELAFRAGVDAANGTYTRPEFRLDHCPLHAGRKEVQIRRNGEWMCLQAAVAAPAPTPAPEREHIVIRDFLTGREMSHEETEHGPQPAPELAAASNAEVAYERWIENRNPADVGSMAGFVAGWQAAIAAASGWPLCPNGCGCRLGTEDADQRDCACDGLCCYGEIEVSETFAKLDQLRERVARVAAALDSEALATAPSKKSQIQEDAARRIREAMA